MSDQHPDARPVRARDVAPYVWGLWSLIEGGKPFVNDVMDVRWSEDGSQIILGLDSHNFYFAEPDEDVWLVPIPPSPHRADRPPFVLPLPPVKTTCPTCGHVEITRSDEDIFGVRRTRPTDTQENKP